MKHCSLFCAGIWPFLILPLLLLAVLLFFMQESIEQKVALNARQSLARNHTWATAETHQRGRDVLLTGTAPDIEAIAKAKTLTLQADGVRVVDFAGDISILAKPQTLPAKLELEFSNNQVVLSGEVSDQAAIDKIVTAANSKYGAERVVNQLRAGSTPGLLPWANIITSLGEYREGGSTLISKQEIRLNGNVKSQSISDSIEADLKIIYGGELDNNLIIQTNIVAEQCIDQLTFLLSKSNINFDSGKAQIKESSNPLLQEIVDTATRCPNAVFEVAGHTDSSGVLDLNVTLSEIRAEAVINHLANLGLNPQRFIARGYGPSQAIADNSTSSGRAANRRIEFKIRK